MRSVIRPVFVGLAVVGMSLAGAASAQACGNFDSPKVHVNNFENNIEDSFNDFNFNVNNSIIDG